MQWATNLDLNKNELQNAKLQNLAVAPANSSEGIIYTNTTDHITYVHNGTGFVDITKQGTVTNVTGTAPIVSSGGTTPVISISPATASSAGSVSAAHFSLVENATSSNTASTLVKRDSAGAISTGVITVNPPSAGAPFVLSANSQGQKVIGLNAELLDGIDSSAFPQLGVNNIFTTWQKINGGLYLNKLSDGSQGALLAHDGTQLTISNLLDATPTVFDAMGGLYITTDMGNTKKKIYHAGNLTLDTVPVPTASVNMNSQKITGLADPTLDQDAVTKAYADTLRAGLSIKDPVRVASTANVVIATGTLLTIDGVTTVAGDRVLLKNQTTASENGIYVAGTGAWSRASDANTSAEMLAGSAMWVNEGTTNSDSRWVLTTNNTITLGTTALTFTKDFQASDIIPGNGLLKAGNELYVNGTSNRIVANADSIDIASTYVGQTSITTLGAVTTGTWNATDIGVAYGGTGVSTLTGYAKGSGTSAFTGVTVIPATDGGTGLNSYTVGDLLVAGTTTTLTTITPVSSGNVLLSNGYNTKPYYGKVSLTGCVTGALPVANGGTGGATAVAARSGIGATGKYAVDVGDGSSTSIVVTHNLNSLDVIVQVKDKLSTPSMIMCDVQYTSVNAVTLLFATAPTSSQYRCVVVG